MKGVRPRGPRQIEYPKADYRGYQYVRKVTSKIWNRQCDDSDLKLKYDPGFIDAMTFVSHWSGGKSTVGRRCSRSWERFKKDVAEIDPVKAMTNFPKRTLREFDVSCPVTLNVAITCGVEPFDTTTVVLKDYGKTSHDPGARKWYSRHELHLCLLLIGHRFRIYPLIAEVVPLAHRMWKDEKMWRREK